ncbi:MAG: nucleoside triphosphate pyrophosphohydrolase [Paludibacteraceae bacterium]|nr:nucleoside triphosphate pyrophosphohydrolase [Paludibacteraceae bacterium]MBR1923320.1 nucleoside triphosphate pyrophosphohydrolase [Paludibacteraceae bacterium]
MHSRQEQLQAFDRLLTVMNDLREKCPWDRKQTFESLRQNTIEEVNELAAAIVKQDMTDISKELGDVLLHVVFYAKIASEIGEFDIADVCNRLCDKLIFRHPHVYGQAAAASAEEVSKLWEQVKLKEKDGNHSVLGGVPDSLPSLVKAYRIQDKAANVGFDWEQKEDVWDKVKEEIAEFEAEAKEAIPQGEDPTPEQKQKMENEMGDILFALINMARLYHLKPDNALEQTNQKFIRRFNYIEQKAKEKDTPLNKMSLQQMETLWQEAKRTTENKNE